MTKVVHDTDIGSGLEISGGKLNVAGSMATDAEVAAAIAAQYANDTNWIALTPYLVAGMSNYGSGFAGVRFRRLYNRVYLEGLLNTTSIGYVGGIANLPSGFRPSQQHVFLAAVHNGAARIDIGPTGLVQIITNSGGEPWVSLDGISFDLA